MSRYWPLNGPQGTWADQQAAIDQANRDAADHPDTAGWFFHKIGEPCGCRTDAQARLESWGHGAAIALVMGIVATIAIALLVYVSVVTAASRPGLDPTAPQPTPGAAGLVRASGQAPASASDRGPSGAPLRRAVADGAPPHNPGGRGIDEPSARETPALQAGLVSTSGGQVGPTIQALRGLATTYETCDRCAAASGELQALLGPRWLGMKVTVWHGQHHVVVRLVTGCGCGLRRFAGELVPTTIDLSPWAFGRLAPTWHGVIRVLVVHGDKPTLPPTDTVR